MNWIKKGWIRATERINGTRYYHPDLDFNAAGNLIRFTDSTGHSRAIVISAGNLYILDETDGSKILISLVSDISIKDNQIVVGTGSGIEGTNRFKFTENGIHGILDLAPTTDDAGVSLFNMYTNVDPSAFENAIDLLRSKGTKETPTALSSGNQIGILRFRGYTGASYDIMAYINVFMLDDTTGGMYLQAGGSQIAINKEGIRLGMGAFITRIETTVGATGVDTSLVTEQGIREALTAAILVAISGSGTVTEVTSATTNQITVTNETSTPILTIVTAAITNGETALATGDQIYDFVENKIDSINISHGLITALSQSPTGSEKVGDWYIPIVSGGLFNFNGIVAQIGVRIKKVSEPNTWGITTGKEFSEVSLPYEGADSNTDLGSHDLTTTGNITSNRSLLGVGTDADRIARGLPTGFEIASNDGSLSDIAIGLYSDNPTDSCTLFLASARGNVSALTDMQIGDHAGLISYSVWYNGAFRKSASILAVYQGNDGDIVTSRLSFYNTSDNNAVSSGIERFRIDGDGEIYAYAGLIVTNVASSKAIKTTLLSGALTNPPTKAELESLIGAAATLGSGYEVNVWDSANSIMYNVNTDGTDWFYVVKAIAT